MKFPAFFPEKIEFSPFDSCFSDSLYCRVTPPYNPQRLSHQLHYPLPTLSPIELVLLFVCRVLTSDYSHPIFLLSTSCGLFRFPLFKEAMTLENGCLHPAATWICSVFSPPQPFWALSFILNFPPGHSVSNPKLMFILQLFVLSTQSFSHLAFCLANCFFPPNPWPFSHLME